MWRFELHLIARIESEYAIQDTENKDIRNEIQIWSVRKCRLSGVP